MKTQVWVYIVVVILSVGAGVAIAGVPSSVSQDPTIQVPATTEAALPTDPPVTEPETTEPVATAPVDTEPEATDPPDTEPTDTEPTDTEPIDTEVETTEPIGTDSAPASTEVDAPTTTVLLLARENIDLSVANGANVGGAATTSSEFLEELGYVDVGSFDGDVIVDVTVIFAAEGFQGEADRIAEELGIEAGLVFPLGAAPPIGGLGETEVIVYLGRDVVDLPYFA